MAGARRQQTDAAQVAENVAAQYFASGADAMAKTLADEFARFPGVRITCDDVADKIRQSPRPQLRAMGVGEEA